jgi:hypothetical protein
MLRSLMPMRWAQSALGGLVGGIGQQHVGQTPQAQVARHRQMQVFHRRTHQLVKQGGDEALFSSAQGIQLGKTCRLEQELAQQGDTEMVQQLVGRSGAASGSTKRQ